MSSPHIRSKYKIEEDLVADDDENTWLLLDHKKYHSLPPPNDHGISSFLSYLLDPNYRPYRYIIAILVSIIDGLTTYCYEYPASLQSDMIKVMKLDNTHYDTFICSNTWPDIVMSTLGTVFVDKYVGMRKGLVIFTTIVFIGQCIVSAGAYMNVFEVMLAGRLILGCGLGTSTGLASTYLVTWFTGKEINSICALSRCFHRLCAALGLFIPRVVYESLTGYVQSPINRHGTAHMTCTLLCMVGIFAAVTVGLMDARGAKIIGRKPMRKNLSVTSILSFPTSFWILVIVCSLHYGLIAAITGNIPLYFISKYRMTISKANLANSLSYLAVVFITPLIGILIDITGYNLLWGVLGLYFALGANLIYTISRNVDTFAPYLAALMYSIAYTLFGAGLWISPGFLVASHQVTTAFGVLLSFMSISITTMSLTSGIIIDHLGYLILLILFVVTVYVAILLSSYLCVYEVVSGVRVLNISGKARRLRKQNT